MKIKTLRKESTDKLHSLVDEKRKELYAFRAGLSGGKIRNVKSARSLRRDIARALTLLEEGARAEVKAV